MIVVFDCIGEFYSKSINKELVSCPDLTNRFNSWLMYWHDFEKTMWHLLGILNWYCTKWWWQMNITFLQFLWWEEGDLNTKTSWIWTELSSPSYSNHALKKTAVNNEPKFGKKIEGKVSKAKSSWNTVMAIRKHWVFCEISWMTKFSSKLISKRSHYRDDECFHHLIQCMIPPSLNALFTLKEKQIIQ